MTKTKRFNATGVILTLILLLIAGCSKQPQTSTKSGDILNYSFGGDVAYNFNALTKVSQLIVFGGQEISADIESIISYSVTKTGENEDKIDLNIKIDSIYNIVKSPQGDMISNPEEVKNVEFNMKLSRKGEESHMDEAAAIKYAGIGGETVDLKTSFSFIFPDFPAGASGIGYAWVDNDTIDMSSAGQTVLMIINSNNTITAKENYNGYDCYKIEYTTTGERNASGDTPQGFMTQSGDMVGKGYMYYAIKEGLIVKDYNEQKLEGELTIPTGESLPMYMDIIIDSEVKK